MRSLAAWLHGLVDLLLVLSLAVITSVLALQVMFRYFLHAALPWPEELAQFLLILISFLGMYRAFGRNQHIGMNWMPERSRSAHMVKAAGLLLVAVFLVYIGFGGWKLAMSAWHQPSTALRLPMAIPYLIVPLSCLLSVLAVLDRIRRLLSGQSGALEGEQAR
ncbi:MAG TPA: TRAP transporter small permease [Geminicoccus sp.]|uniref:TRAP transporter small permease n=1 Tax=Geminicoccus sp. TaxID=2024832 RepID=UPI002CC81F0B|nr:TRAP transporter small permease [Geminicoccus sp.]HWL66968.1 TRAP transporter small permease [Geminicoccus sp.]